MKKLPEIILLSAAVLALSACSNAKEELGLTRKPPDEFSVVKRAPLAMPPDYALRPPTPGADRPQEANVEDQAREVVFGGEQQEAQKSAPASAESMILQKTGGVAADPSIRRVVDQEVVEEEDDTRPVAERLLGWGGGDDEPAASVVDAQKEAERLKKNEGEGKSVTEGQTPAKVQ